MGSWSHWRNQTTGNGDAEAPHDFTHRIGKEFKTQDLQFHIFTHGALDTEWETSTYLNQPERYEGLEQWTHHVGEYPAWSFVVTMILDTERTAEFFFTYLQWSDGHQPQVLKTVCLSKTQRAKPTQNFART